MGSLIKEFSRRPSDPVTPAKNDLPIVRNIVLSDPRREIVANVIRLNTSRMPNSDFGPLCSSQCVRLCRTWISRRSAGRRNDLSFARHFHPCGALDVRIDALPEWGRGALQALRRHRQRQDRRRDVTA